MDDPDESVGSVQRGKSEALHSGAATSKSGEVAMKQAVELDPSQQKAIQDWTTPGRGLDSPKPLDSRRAKPSATCSANGLQPRWWRRSRSWISDRTTCLLCPTALRLRNRMTCPDPRGVPAVRAIPHLNKGFPWKDTRARTASSSCRAMPASRAHDPGRIRPPASQEMTQTDLPLFNTPTGPCNGTETSMDAAVSIQHKVNAMARKVLDCIRSMPGGLTCEHVEQHRNMKHQTASARIRDLASASRRSSWCVDQDHKVIRRQLRQRPHPQRTPRTCTSQRRPYEPEQIANHRAVSTCRRN